jgi:hypothetical protein
MTSRGPECTCEKTEKHQVWPNGDRCDAGAQSLEVRLLGVRLPARPVRIAAAAEYRPKLDYRSFLDIYDLGLDDHRAKRVIENTAHP